MSEEPTQLGRVAFRVEGKEWVAYYAKPDTMKDAVRVGSLSMAFAEVPERKQEFMALVRQCVADMFDEVLGQRPQWTEPTDAPESERNGSA